MNRMAMVQIVTVETSPFRRLQRIRGGSSRLLSSLLSCPAAPLAGMLSPLPPGSTGGSPRIPAPFQAASGSTGGSPLIPAALSAHAVSPRVVNSKINEILRGVPGSAAVSSPFLARGSATPPLAGMPSQPLPGTPGGSARTPAPFQHAPGSTGGSPPTPAPFQSVPGSTGGISRTPAPLSAQSIPTGGRKSAILVDWWLDRVEGEEGKIRVAGTTFTPQMSPQMRKGASSSKGSRNLARRVFRSSAIVKRHDYTTIESEDGYRIQIGGVLNIPKLIEKGFSKEVCECFEFSFPIIWQRLVNPNMVPDNEHAQSPSETTTSAPGPSVEDYMEMFLSDSFSSSIRYDVAENNFDPSVGYSGNTYGLTTQSLSNLPNDTAGSITALTGLSSISSVSVQQSTGSSSSNSKVDGNILAPSKIPSVVNEGYRSTVGCGQAEENADIQKDNMRSCSSEHGMVTLPIDCKSSQLGEPVIPKSEKDSVSLGTTDALELPTKGMTPKSGAIRGSEDSTGRILRSGKVLGMPSGGLMKTGHKQKKIQLEASSKQMVNQGATSTMDLTCRENDFPAAEVFVEEKLESHDSCRRGPGRPKRKGNKKRKWGV